MNFFLKNLNLTFKIFGWLQIVGGIFGMGLIAYILLSTGTINGVLLLLFLAGIALFIFSIRCGTMLLSPVTREKGMIFSLINQGLQFVQWHVLGYGISYSSPLQLLVGIKGLFSFSFNLSIISSFNMSINSDDAFYININLVAIFIFVVLMKIYGELKKPEQEEIFAPMEPEFTNED